MDNKFNKEKQKFKNFEDFREWVINLTEIERQQYETSKEISHTLQHFVDEQNNKAKKYINDFNERLKEKLEKKIWRKHFGNQKKESVLRDAYKNIDISKKYTQYQNECKQDNPQMKKEIYEAIKRSFNNLYFHKKSDIDKDASKHLLSLVGFFNQRKEYEPQKKSYDIENEHSGKVGLTIDNAGTAYGFSIENVWKLLQNGKKHATLLGSKAIISEHRDKSNLNKDTAKPTSSTHIIYEFLKSMSMINPKYEGQIKRFVDFVDKIDSLNYQFSAADYPNNYRTIFGLYKNMNIKDIYNYFEIPGRLGFELLDDRFMQKIQIEKVFYKNQQRQTKKMTLLDCSKEQKERIDKNMEEFLKLTDRGVNIGNLRFIVTFGDEITDPPQIGSYNDCGIIRIFDSGDFYLYSPEKLPPMIGDEKTDDHFLIKKKISQEKLENIIVKMIPRKDTDPDLGNKIREYRKSIDKKPSVITT